MRAISTVLNKTISARVTEEEHRIYMERGGSDYLRKLLSGKETAVVDIEAVVRRVLAEGGIPSPAPEATTEKMPKVVADHSGDDEITNSIISIFDM